MIDSYMDSRLYDLFFERLRQIPISSNTPALEPDIRYALTQALGMLMSDVSEGKYAAGWLNGLEDQLPFELLAATARQTGVDVPYYPGEEVTPPLVRGMCALADLLGHWANYEWYPVAEGGGEQYVPYKPDPDHGTISGGEMA